MLILAGQCCRGLLPGCAWAVWILQCSVGGNSVSLFYLELERFQSEPEAEPFRPRTPVQDPAEHILACCLSNSIQTVKLQDYEMRL